MSEIAPDIVDSHVHLLPGRLAHKVRAFFHERISGDRLVYPLDHATVLARLYSEGIRAIWSLPYAHKAGIAAGLNAASAHLVRDHRGGPVEITGGATVHPRDAHPAEIVREALDHYGLKVLKLHCSVGNFSPDDPALRLVWQLVSERRMPVVLHLGRAVSGHTSGDELDHLERIAREYPEARLIVAHCGHHAASATLDLLERYPALYADLTPVVFELVELSAGRAARLYSKLLFGSDAPNTGLPAARVIEQVRGFGLDPAAEQAILGGNARRLVAEVLS